MVAPKKKGNLLPLATSPGFFRYQPLDHVRALSPLGYVLVDEMIDLIGFNMFREAYPKSSEDFSVSGNYADAPVDRGDGIMSERVWPSVSHVGGPGVSYLNLQHGPDRKRGDKERITVRPDVLKFRSIVWKQALDWIRSGKLTAYELSADGRCTKILRRERGLVAFQSEHIIRTGSAWRVEGFGTGHRMLVCFMRGNLRELIHLASSQKGNLKRRPLQLTDTQIIELLKDLGALVQFTADPLSKTSAKEIIEATFREEVKFPGVKRMDSIFTKVKQFCGPGAFCEDGEKCFYSGFNDTQKRRFQNKLTQYRDMVASGKIARAGVFMGVKKLSGTDVAGLAADILFRSLQQADGYQNENSEE